MSFDTRDPAVTAHEGFNATLLEGQILAILHHLLHPLTVKRLVRLSPRRPDGRALLRVQHAELDPGLVDGPGHLAAKGVDLLDQMPFSDAANGRIAGHLTDVIEVQRQHQRLETHAGGRQRGFNSRMSGPDNDDIVDLPFSVYPTVSRETSFSDVPINIY